ncbi:DUF1501 domain-containing protein [bacterium]|nr:DUF1501 domain-containing protein [bacterium]
MKRREFFSRAIAASAGVASVPLFFRGIPVHAGSYGAIGSGQLSENDNVLVIIQLFGGNDGLNTFVPYTNQQYYQNRPTLGISPQEVLRIANPTMGFHPDMTGMRNLFDAGKLVAVQGVGYENANRSHFRSENIWLTGSGAGSVLDTGWLGRYLEITHPTYPLQLPPDPFAVQIGGTLSLMLQADRGNMGITLADPETFFRLGRNQVDEAVPGGTPYGEEYLFVRAIKEQSDVYSQRVNDAFTSGTNVGNYSGSSLSQQLRLVARLISGGLQSKVYMVYLGGFDTHSNQASAHARLLQNLSSAAEEFVDDLKNQGLGKRVVGMTMSEFGRRTRENGSSGTDHGTASVQFLFGESVNSGVLGQDPDFDVTDNSGDLLHDFDYRQIYSELLEHWFELPADDVTQLLGGRFTPLPLVRTTTAQHDAAAPLGFSLSQNYPNPVANGHTTIPFTLAGRANVELLLYDVRGSLIAAIARGSFEAGRHEAVLQSQGLPAGVYYYQLRVGTQKVSRKLVVR